MRQRRSQGQPASVGLLDAYENAKPIVMGLLGVPTEEEGRQMGLLDSAFLDAHAAGDRRGMAEIIGQRAALVAPYFAGAGTIKAYHGSPHNFDKFKMDRIGTGEGAQAYGHGLYFAENENVAQNYRAALKLKGHDGSSETEMLRSAGFTDEDMRQLQPFLDTASDAQGAMRQFSDWTGKKATPEMQSAVSAVLESRPKGSMYEVNINANPDDFLDWDKPFASADDVERFAAKFDGVDPALRKKIEDYGYMRQQAGQPMPDGNDILREVFGGVGEKASQQATRTMSEAGIPGIKYFDGNSRSSGEGSRNYVVFDENLINIVKKYGIAGAVSAGLLTSEQAQAFMDQQNDHRAVKP